ncbi:MAG TPA: methylated-DNA--[protein]-cysteine S-methyltransferase [Gammaproteobacteria bacterium]
MITGQLQSTLILASPLPGQLRLGVVIDSQGITQLDFVTTNALPSQGASALEAQLQREVADYFLKPLRCFQLPLSPAGTPFQQRVWRRMREIPAGTTLTYGELARELTSGARAVAAACRANPIPLLIPCHRVVARDGLGGYMGAMGGEALEIKRWLLHHEGAI